MSLFFENIFGCNLIKLIDLLTIWLNYMVKKKDQTTEEKILAAAKKVFVVKGMAGARMQEDRKSVV